MRLFERAPVRPRTAEQARHLRAKQAAAASNTNSAAQPPVTAKAQVLQLPLTSCNAALQSGGAGVYAPGTMPGTVLEGGNWVLITGAPGTENLPFWHHTGTLQYRWSDPTVDAASTDSNVDSTAAAGSAVIDSAVAAGAAAIAALLQRSRPVRCIGPLGWQEMALTTSSSGSTTSGASNTGGNDSGAGMLYYCYQSQQQQQLQQHCSADVRWSLSPRSAFGAQDSTSSIESGQDANSNSKAALQTAVWRTDDGSDSCDASVFFSEEQ
jgi:hypothetical protein